MPHAPHQTTPFRRPSTSWPHDVQPDPAEVGTAFGLELCLAGDGESTPAPHSDASDGDNNSNAPLAAPILCP